MTTKLQSLTQLWQDFDLPGTQRLLDDLATEITTKQDGSDVSRKQLIDLMRNFKKSNTEETRLAVAPLLKSFQNEIDSLSKRSKSAEKAFFDIYKKFCDIADPVPTLGYCMESMKNLQKLQDMEIETNQLRETLAEYNVEMAELRTQAKRVEEVEEKLKEYEKNMEDSVELAIIAKEDELNKVFEDKVKNLEEDKLRTTQKLTDAEQKTKMLQSMLDQCQNELFDLRAKQDQKKNAVTDEMDLLMTDLDRANQRAISAEKEVALLQDKLAELKEATSLNQHDQEFDNSEAKDLKMQLNAKEAEVVQLVEDVQKAHRTLQDNDAKNQKRISQLERDLAEVNADRSQLDAKLQHQSDYESIKKDLSILKTLEFPAVETEDDTRPLEVLIMERSKALQAENSMLRLDKERLLRDLTSAKSDLEDAEGKTERQSVLIQQLEEHVEQLQTISTPFREEAEGRSSSDMLAEALRVDSHPTDPVFERCSLSPAPQYSSSDCSQAAALLPIVQSQRERFRLRNEELETAGLEQQQQVMLLTRQVQDLQADNLKLYEKIRFLQACGGGAQGRGDTVVPVETRYQDSYEQKLDPFSNFSKQEKQRKYGQLSVFEKVILSLVRFIVSNKTARLVVFFYSVLLHGLVFAVLYKLALTESCRHDMAAQWHEKYVQHMEHVHAGEGALAEG